MGDGDMEVDVDAAGKEDDAASDAGSEDLEAESSGSDEEDDDEGAEEGAEEAVDEDMEMGEGHAAAPANPEVMAH